MYFFTADEHYGHTNIIKYCNRPFKSVEEMNEVLISNHNSLIGDNDMVVHVGDFTLQSFERAMEYLDQLKGKHIFLRGSHDYWLKKVTPVQDIYERKFNDIYIIACHYPMRTWPRSHHGSWQVHGHSHGMLSSIGKQWDVGVDNNDFMPVSMWRLKEIMKDLPDNLNLI